VIAGDVSVVDPYSREETVMGVSAKDKPAFLPESQKKVRMACLMLSLSHRL
jgi:hypothetical protein